MKTLEAKGVKINIISNLHARPNFGLKWRSHFYRWQGKNYQYERTHCYTRQFGEQVNKQLSANADFILSTTSSALAYIKTNKPVYLYTDATFDNLAEYYGHFSRLPASSKKMGDDVERLAYKNCTGLFFSSHWAAESATQFYLQPEKKVFVIPFGANMEDIPSTEEVQSFITAKKTTSLNLLWSGVEYTRKGGDLSLELARTLNDKGIPTFISFIGVDEDQTGTLPSFAKAYGFLSKQDKADVQQINKLFQEAHFFILPTLLDCTPVVFNEAAAFGLPALSFNISGIADQIIDHQTGFLFSPGDALSKWASAIQNCMSIEKYLSMSMASRTHYDDHLNWPTTAKTILEIVKSVEPNE
ncbi:MAG TPA: glycosyltransferase family 4 protein [Phnomibacter sp.]|nr:glycosyltransferase family 4 protein [Phnomibacter sp.]